MTDQLLKDASFLNWLKCHLAMFMTKQGIEATIEEDLEQFIRAILKKHNVVEMSSCNLCTTKLILSCPTKNFCVTGRQNRCISHGTTTEEEVPGRDCPRGICHHIRNEIRKQHSYLPNWKITDATRWSSDLLEIAKCFMPPNGYRNVNKLKDADFNGFLSILINKKSFGLTKETSMGEKVTEVRKLSNEIRHSANLTVSRTYLETFVDSLISLLSNAQCFAKGETAKKAVEELNLLKKNEVTVPVRHIEEVLNNATHIIDKRDVEYSTENDTDRMHTEDEIQIPRKMIDDLKTEIANKETLKLAQLDSIVTLKLQTLKEMKKEIKDEVVKEIYRNENEEDFLQQPYGFDIRSCMKYKRLCKSLCQDLGNFYRRSHGTIPIAPLIEENDVPLEEFYVQPTARSREITNSFIGSSSATAKHIICSYRDLFLSGKKPYKDIYITAKAGLGKTSFVKKICLTWCQAKSPVNESARFYQTEDINTLQVYDFLFMISLKEMDKNECDINKMIYRMLQKCMPFPRLYSRKLLDKILHEKCVLIMLDGLDEWMHPESCEHKTDVIPHRRTLPNCTILTTTRPWKLNSARISNSQIDMLVELGEFDETKSNLLLTSAVKLLNKISQPSRPSKTEEDFRKKTSTIEIGALKSIPYIFLQLICLWFDDCPIGNSQCQIYSNTIELNLVRGKSIVNETATEIVTTDDVTYPVCLTANKECLRHYYLLLKLGKLAFETLTSGRNESALIFDDSVVNRYLSSDEQEFLLNKGLLSKNKDYSKVAGRKSIYSFQQKTMQEYFAALYMHSCPNNPELREQIVTEYNTLESMLQLSNMFVFLGGFSPVAYQNMVDLQKHVMSSDETITTYRCHLAGRTSLPEYRKCWETVKSFQIMQIDILQEMLRNNHPDFNLYLEDIVLDNSVTDEKLCILGKIIKQNIDNIKSLSTEQSKSMQELSKRLSKIDPPSFKCLQKLEVIAIPSQHHLEQLLTNSKQSIKSLDLCFANFSDGHYHTKYTTLPSETIRTILCIDHLESLRLNSIRLPHEDIQELLEHIKGKTTMTEVGLCHIECLDIGHSGECGTLELSRHRNLQTLRIGTIPISKLDVNCSSLNFCYTGSLSTSVHKQLVGCLSNAANLGTLRLKYLKQEQVPLYTEGSLTKMKQLTSFALEYADFGERSFVLSPEMKSMERLHLYEVAMTTRALQHLIRSVEKLPQAVLVIIESCDILPTCCTRYQMITEKIRKSAKYRVRYDSEKKFSFETGYARIDAKYTWDRVTLSLIVAGLASAVLGVIAMFYCFVPPGM